MSLWPFMPVGDILEVLEWRTDVIRAKSAEQRIQLRARPRRSWQFRHVFSHEQAAAARAIVRATTDVYQVPDWTRFVYGGPVASGTSVSLTVDTTDLDLEAGAQVVVWVSATDWEICAIESVSAGGIVLASVTTARASAAVWPLDHAHAQAELAIQRPAGRHLFGDIIFIAPASVVDCGASTMPTYRGHDLLTDIPVVGGGELDEGVAWPMDVLDGDLGGVYVQPARTRTDANMAMRWHIQQPAAARTLRKWLHSRRGRLKAFWRSSLAYDLTAAAGIDAAATSLRVYTPAVATSLGETEFDIEINGLAVYRRRVTAVQAGPAVSGRATLDLTLDSALSATHTAGQLGRLSFLRCLRFAADRIELLHRPGAGVQVAVPCCEVPVP